MATRSRLIGSPIRQQEVPQCHPVCQQSERSRKTLRPPCLRPTISIYGISREVREECEMRVDLREIAQTDVLAGADNGRSVLVRLLEATRSEPAEPEPLF